MRDEEGKEGRNKEKKERTTSCARNTSQSNNQYVAPNVRKAIPDQFLIAELRSNKENTASSIHSVPIHLIRVASSYLHQGR